jgi:DNA-binding NarL/FixJ family response regulator
MVEYNEDNPIKIIMADDHEVVRAGLRRLLSVDKSIKVLDEAYNGKDAVDLVNYHKPDIALLDILMPQMNGIEATQKIKETTDTYVLMLTAYEDSYHLEQALTAGADGYLAKDIGAKELISSIHSVMHGERAFSKSIIKIMQKKYVPEEEQDSAPVIITKREQEILNLVALGKTSQEIANELFISIRTVESHRYNIMQKLDIKNTAGLVRYSVMNSKT